MMFAFGNDNPFLPSEGNPWVAAIGHGATAGMFLLFGANELVKKRGARNAVAGGSTTVNPSALDPHRVAEVLQTLNITHGNPEPSHLPSVVVLDMGQGSAPDAGLAPPALPDLSGGDVAKNISDGVVRVTAAVQDFVQSVQQQVCETRTETYGSHLATATGPAFHPQHAAIVSAAASATTPPSAKTTPPVPSPTSPLPSPAATPEPSPVLHSDAPFGGNDHGVTSGDLNGSTPAVVTSVVKDAGRGWTATVIDVGTFAAAAAAGKLGMRYSLKHCHDESSRCAMSALVPAVIVIASQYFPAGDLIAAGACTGALLDIGDTSTLEPFEDESDGYFTTRSVVAFVAPLGGLGAAYAATSFGVDPSYAAAVGGVFTRVILNLGMMWKRTTAQL